MTESEVAEIKSLVTGGEAFLIHLETIYDKPLSKTRHAFHVALAVAESEAGLAAGTLQPRPADGTNKPPV